MPSRAADWFKQALHDLELSRRAAAGGDFEWSCFAAQQAAENALKALYQKVGGEARGHSVSGLLEELPASMTPDPALEEAAKALDKHYIPARYPNAYSRGAPYEYYTKTEAERAIAQSEQILRFCQGHLS